MAQILAETLGKHGFTPYPNSIRSTEWGQVFAARRGAQKAVGIVRSGDSPMLSSPILQETLPTGERISLHPLDWENYEALRKMIPISPSTADKTASFGTGDRLGLVSAAHLNVLSGYPVFPVIAQQSPRELIKTNRDFQDVLLKAVMGVLESGYTGAYGADADHIKDEAYLMEAARAGYSMYTLDVSDWLQDPTQSTPDHLSELSRSIVAEYSGKSISGDYTISGNGLIQSAMVYEKSMEQIIGFHDMLERVLPHFDLEVSIDEGARDTTVEDHLFVAEYLHQNEIDFTSLAPKFPGQFQKGVDYEGDIEALARSLALHGNLCREIGGYRLSLHSGSDKFSIYPLFAETAGGEFHIKTSGTSWLQAVEVLAVENPSLFEELYSLCLENLDESKKAYHVKITHSDFPNALPDDVSEFFARPDVRQLFHISYGVLLDERRDAIYDTLTAHEEEHYSSVARHIGAHLKLLFQGS